MAWSLLILSFIPILLYIYLSIPIQTQPPQIDKDEFFGSGEMTKNDETSDPFTIQFTTQIKEMHRLAKKSVNEFTEGSLERRIVSFLSEFNWEQHSHFINSFPQFTTEIEGLSIHFVHTSLKHEKRVNALPILLLPSSFSSFWSFFKLLPILSNPSRHGFHFGLTDNLVFNVVIPSYPMTLFSDSPRENNMDMVDVSRIMNKLMVDRLSYSKYYIYGDGGIGSEIGSIISTIYPSKVSGLIIKDPIISMDGMRRQAQLWIDSIFHGLIPSDSIETKIELPLSIPLLNDQSFSSYIKYLIQRWRESSQLINIDREITLDEISTSFSLFILTNSLKSHIDLLKSTIPHSILEGTTTVSTFVISSRTYQFHIPKSLLVHKFMNLTRYDEINHGGILYPLSKSSDLAQKIFSFIELC